MILSPNRSLFGLVVGVPHGDARVIPVVAHPVLVLADHLVRVVGAGIALVPAGAAGPDEELVLNQQADLVADVQPAIRHRADAEAEIVPVHLLGQLAEQLAHPGFVPGQVPAQRILEEAVQRDVRAAQVIDLAVQVGPLRGGVETKLAHPEAGADRVAARARFQHVQKRILRRPQMSVGNRDRLRHDLLLAGCEGDCLRRRSGDLLSAFPRFHRVHQRRRCSRCAAVPDLGLHGDLALADSRRDLYRLDPRIVAEDQRHAVVDAGRPLDLLEIRARGVRVRQHGGMSADAHDQRVLLVPADGFLQVEVAGGEAAGVFAQFAAVQPDGRAELGLVDLEQRHRPRGRRAKRLPIPEVIAILIDLALPMLLQPLGRRQLPANAIAQLLAAEKSVHALETAASPDLPCRGRGRCV